MGALSTLTNSYTRTDTGTDTPTPALLAAVWACLNGTLIRRQGKKPVPLAGAGMTDEQLAALAGKALTWIRDTCAVQVLPATFTMNLDGAKFPMDAGTGTAAPIVLPLGPATAAAIVYTRVGGEVGGMQLQPIIRGHMLCAPGSAWPVPAAPPEGVVPDITVKWSAGCDGIIPALVVMAIAELAGLWLTGPEAVSIDQVNAQRPRVVGQYLALFMRGG